MKAPSTLAFLLRWHLLQFLWALLLVGVGVYGLVTHESPAPSALDAVASSPFAENFVPLMWLAVVTGIAVAGSAWNKARSTAGK